MSLNWHITRHTTPNIIFDLPCVYSSLLKLEILHPNSRGTTNYTISQRLRHIQPFVFTNNTGQKVEYKYLIQRKLSRSKMYWVTKWRNDISDKVKARFQPSNTSTVHRVDQILCKASPGRSVILLE